jgi:hypothetical protein
MTESEADTPALPPSDESERKPRIPDRIRRKLLMGGIFIAIFAIPIGLWAWDYSVCPLIQVVPAGMSVSIAPGSYVDYAFNVTKVLNTNRAIYGSLTSSGPVIVYVTTAQQFSYWTPTGPSGPYEYSSGIVTSLSYSTCGGKYQPPCPPNSLGAPQGKDYLVMRNPGQTSIVVVIGTAMVVQTC